MCSLLLKYAAAVVSQNYVLIIYVILFVIATAAVFILGYFQILTFIQGDFYNPGVFGKIMFVLVVFEITWALFFLK